MAEERCHHFKLSPEEVEALVQRVNTATESYPAKDWNYSRITLVPRRLDDCNAPYVLWVELIDTRTKQGQEDLKAASNEVAWGERHSNELGILELASLRLNKALLECTSDEYWEHRRPLVRLVKTNSLRSEQVTTAFWYAVDEIAGEDFDNR